MYKEDNCPICKSRCHSQRDFDTNNLFYVCPVCGRYELTLSRRDFSDNPHLAPYLFYHRFGDDEIEYRYHTTLDKERCDKYNKAFEEGNNTNGRPVHMDESIIESWYPKTFSERVDLILLRLHSLAGHVGHTTTVAKSELPSLLFVDRKEKVGRFQELKWRDQSECNEEALYMLENLIASHWIKCEMPGDSIPEIIKITLTPQGYSRVDDLQKKSGFGRNVLVAMKFGDETTALRESIRKGISNAGFHAIFIDEVQHNEFITPELLKYIRDSKFVVADLTHQNNGAYFEEGYAMGLGKPVIQLCRRGVRLHFDIAQKNTIMWENENDIPELLENRIKATID